MAETLSPNYGWTKPDPGASANTWGATLNATTDKIDTKVYANEQGLAPIGAVTMFAGAAAPANWLICDGRSLSTAAPYDKLFAVLQYAFGGSGANFNLPNLTNRFPMGGGTLAATGGEATHVLAYGEMPAHQHNVPDPQHYHNISQGSIQHTHAANQNPHSHSANQDAHSHGGVLVSGGTFAFGSPAFTAQPGRTDTQQPAVHIDTQQPVVNIGANSTGITNTDYGATGISVTDVQGGGAAHNNLPPYVALNFIVRYI